MKKLMLACLLVFSKTLSAFDAVSYCVYQNDDCIESAKAIDKSDVSVIVEGVITGEKDFIVFEDKQGTSIQFYVDQLDNIWVEIPRPNERGSYGKHISSDEMKLIIDDLVEPYSDYQQKLTLKFLAW